MKDDFYERVKNTLPCNMDEWTDEQLKSQLNHLNQGRRPTSAIEFYKQMIESVANRRGLDL